MKTSSADISSFHESSPFRAKPSEARSPNARSLPASVRHGDDRETNRTISANARIHLLVVDDDAGVRDVLTSFLRRSGYRVSCANDGEAAWEALCANSFNTMITDHGMPRLTGLDLLRRVRISPLKALPIILMSGEMPWGERDLLDLVWPGVAMEKPFSLLELLTSVRGVLTMTTRAEPAYA